jgi:Tfp pilus assembly protein PilZ
VRLTWCAVCGGSHDKPQDCPGELRATGDERHGWRVTVDTPYGLEAYGVLVAPSYDLWRARIITYPNILWTVPGGIVTLKFGAETAQEAESRAVAFIQGHIKALGYVPRESLDAPSVSRYRSEAQAQAAAAGPAIRKVRAIPVRFGTGPTLFAAMTGNLSETGLFVATLAPFDPGTGLRVLMDLETGPVGLKGQVVWKRDRVALGRQMGMGVSLIGAPETYREFVIELP